MKANFRDYFFMLGLTTICTLFVMLTREGISNAGVLAPASIKAVFSILNLETKDKTPIDEAFTTYFSLISKDEDKIKVWQSNEAKEIAVIKCEGPGMWGKIGILLVFNSEERKIVGIQVETQNETPGLGSKISSARFLKQFSGMKVNKNVSLVNNPDADNEFDAITGATISSKAFGNVVTSAISSYDAMSAKTLGVEHE